MNTKFILAPDEFQHKDIDQPIIHKQTRLTNVSTTWVHQHKNKLTVTEVKNTFPENTDSEFHAEHFLDWTGYHSTDEHDPKAP